MAIRQPSSRPASCAAGTTQSASRCLDNHPEAGEILATVSIPAHSTATRVSPTRIVAALLDEAAGRSILLDGDFDQLMVTAKLEVRYHKPTPTDTPLLLVGRLDRGGDQHAEARAELRLPDGTISARARCCWRARRSRSAALAGRAAVLEGGRVAALRSSAAACEALAVRVEGTLVDLGAERDLKLPAAGGLVGRTGSGLAGQRVEGATRFRHHPHEAIAVAPC